jgi:hypothetical protein
MESRLARLASGVTVNEIAAADGVSRSRIVQAVRGAIYRLADARATPGADVPEGLQWIERTTGPYAGTWYVEGIHRGTARQLADRARWAMALAVPIERVCALCGREL